MTLSAFDNVDCTRFAKKKEKVNRDLCMYIKLVFVKGTLAFALCSLYALLCFIACDILPDCALRLDGKAWPHPQTARLTLTVVLHCGHALLNLLSIRNRSQN